MDIETVAMTAHEVNAAYCRAIGDNSQPSWKDAPEWQKKSAIDGVNFHLSRIAQGNPPTPAESHESWLKEKTADGWKYGPVKDVERKEHPCFRPYDQLPLEQRVKDSLFSAVVLVFAGQVGELAK